MFANISQFKVLYQEPYSIIVWYIYSVFHTHTHVPTYTTYTIYYVYAHVHTHTANYMCYILCPQGAFQYTQYRPTTYLTHLCGIKAVCTVYASSFAGKMHLACSGPFVNPHAFQEHNEKCIPYDIYYSSHP